MSTDFNQLGTGLGGQFSMVPQFKRKPVAEINIVPYVDVMLVLLIIFMATAPMLTQGIQVELPGSKAEAIESDPEQKTPIIVSIDKSGALYLNVLEQPEAPVEKSLLLARVVAELNVTPSRLVLVKGDRHANYGQVVEAMNLLKQAGVVKVGLLTQDQGGD